MHPDTPAPSARFQPSGTHLGIMLLLAVLCVAGLSAWHLWSSREQAVSAIQEANLRKAQDLDQHLAGNFQAIDRLLLEVREEALRHQRDGAIDLQALQPVLERRPPMLPGLEALRVSDAQGRLLASTSSAPGSIHDLSDRPYFQRIRQDPTGGLVIEGPLWGRISGAWIVIFARRIEDARGTFLGGVYATMPLDAFRHLLADLNPGVTAAVLAKDGTALCVHPLIEGAPPAVGQRLLGSLPPLPANAPAHLTGPLQLDGEPRVLSLRRMASHDLLLLIGQPVGTALAPWRSRAIPTLALTLILVGLLLGMAVLGRRLQASQREAQAQLARQESMYRLLTESATEVIWTTDDCGRLRYVSPSIRRQRGFTQEEFLALAPEETFADEEGRALFRETLAATLRAKSLSQPFEGQVLQANCLRKSGTTFPAEIHLGILWDASGGLQGIRGVTRDITRRKAAETQRDQLIEALTQALAELKTLKGMLPICCSCKKVRDDRGAWNQIEAYIAEHSEATFTHGYCPECARRQFPEVFTE